MKTPEEEKAREETASPPYMERSCIWGCGKRFKFYYWPNSEYLEASASRFFARKTAEHDRICPNAPKVS